MNNIKNKIVVYFNMKAGDLFLTFMIILVFVAIYAFNILSIGMAKIKQNWPVYRCNPMIMPFASYFGHEPVANFTYCIQNMQTSYMTSLMKPAEYAMSILKDTLGSIMTDIQYIRKKIADFVGTITNIIKSIFSVFINILIQFQRIIIKLKDVFGKVLGTMTTLIYLIEGGILTGTTVMAGPIGGTLRFLCFHPNTLIALQNGIRKKISTIEPGEILTNGSKVLASLKVVGNQNDSLNTYYELFDSMNNTNIYVTGSHKIHDSVTNRFISVKEHNLAVEAPDITSSSMSCLVTDDHLIQIGNFMFWDWED